MEIGDDGQKNVMLRLIAHQIEKQSCFYACLFY